MWTIPTGISSTLKKKKSGKESQYMFSHPETGSDPPIWSDLESGCDTRSFPLPFEAHSCQVGLSVIRYRVLPNWVPVFP